MMTALRAVKDLLFGSKQIPSVTEYKLHAKQGGIGRALEDFESVDLKNIQHYTSTAQVEFNDSVSSVKKRGLFLSKRTKKL